MVDYRSFSAGAPHEGGSLKWGKKGTASLAFSSPP